MPSYTIDIPGKGSYTVNSPTDLSDYQAYMAAQQHRDTISAHLQAAKISSASRAGIDEDTIARGFAKAVEAGEFKNTPEDYQRYKSLFTGMGGLPSGVTVTKNK
jgi:hypothetical protein